jgi:hypothetical protein
MSMVEAQILARRRRISIVAVQKGKDHMDYATQCDMMGRWTFHFGEWGLAPKIMQQAVKNLGHNAWDHQMVDLFSSTMTVQPSATSAISRWPEDHHKILHRPNALNYH